MSEIKHTPRPWFISPQNKFIRAEGVHGWNIAQIEEQDPYTEANAKLIAAAPDMFEVIKEMYDWAITHNVHGPIFPKIEAVYKKVTE